MSSGTVVAPIASLAHVPDYKQISASKEPVIIIYYVFNMRLQLIYNALVAMEEVRKDACRREKRLYKL